MQLLLNEEEVRELVNLLEQQIDDLDATRDCIIEDENEDIHKLLDLTGTVDESVILLRRILERLKA